MTTLNMSNKTFTVSNHLRQRFQQRVLNLGFDISFEDLIDDEYFESAREFTNKKGETQMYFITTIDDVKFGIGFFMNGDNITLSTILDPKMVEDNDEYRNGIEATHIRLID